MTEFTVTDLKLKAEYLTIYVDWLSAVGVGDVGMILLSPEKDVLKYGVHL